MMSAISIRFAVLIFTGSALAGCAGGPLEEEYRLIPLREVVDPLAPRKEFPAWRPPRQFAVWVHPHEDAERKTLFGGRWMMILLDEGSWYLEEGTEEDPVPDAEASSEDVRAAVSALSRPGDAVVPYRLREDGP